MVEPRVITFREAVLEALFLEMRADPNVMLIGEDVGAAGGVFKQTEGLLKTFGATRIVCLEGALARTCCISVR